MFGWSRIKGSGAFMPLDPYHPFARGQCWHREGVAAVWAKSQPSINLMHTESNIQNVIVCSDP